MSSIYTDYAILATGITSVLTGSIVLLSPTATTTIFSHSIHPDTAPSIQANAVSSIATGVYHIIAYHQANEDFYKASIFMRLLFTLVFWIEQREGVWWLVSMYNLFGAVITAMLLAVEEESPYPVLDNDWDNGCDCAYDSDGSESEYFDVN